MPSKRSVVSWDDARKLAWQLGADSATALGASTHDVPLKDALGYYTATDVTAPYPLPHYASSAMDGWALGPQLGESNAWQVVDSGSSAHLSPGEAMPVVTGQAIPEGTAVVLPLEIATQPATHVVSTDPAALPHALTPGRHIRSAGTEARAGEVLVPRGTRLSPVHLALIAATGADSVKVSQRVDVALVRSGNEVIESGVPAVGQVRDSFSLLLPPAVQVWGGTLVSASGIRDDLDATLRALGESARLLVTTGGTGPSSADHLLDALQSLGARMVFSSVRMRPGHPSVLARLPDGRIVLGLPGNPLAAVTAALSFLPALMAGLRGEGMPALATLSVAEAIEPLPGRTRVIPAVLAQDGLHRAEWTGSGMLRGLTQADVLMVIPAEGVAAGDPVEALPLPWPALLTGQTPRGQA